MAIQDYSSIRVHSGSFAVNSISDTGKGMPPEKVETLFELGFTTKDARVGMPMGLINAYSIIQNHRGDLKVESEVSKGSTFTIVLPMDLKETLKTE